MSFALPADATSSDRGARSGARGERRVAGASDARAGMAVGIIGAGRVGAVLGAALARTGRYRLVAASGVSDASKSRIARLLPGTPNVPADAVARSAAELLIIAVPDDALAAVVTGLAGIGALRPGQIVAHTSGAHGLAVLAPAAALGARPLALHPAMTFTGRRGDLDKLTGTSFGVTAPEDLRPFATRLAADLGGRAEWVPEADRALYHAALAHGANHLVTLTNEALDLLREAGVTRPEKVLGPLLLAAMGNTLELGDAALTGPVSRGDAGTVSRHLDQLAAVRPESLPPYLALARRTADRAIAAGQLRPADAEPLLDVLRKRSRSAKAARSAGCPREAVAVAGGGASGTGTTEAAA